MAMGLRLTRNLPAHLDVWIGSRFHRLSYPFPVSGSRYKVRVSRNSRSVIVIVPFPDSMREAGFEHYPFPILFDKTSARISPTAWDMGQVSLDHLPQILVKPCLTTIGSAPYWVPRSLIKRANFWRFPEPLGL